MPRPRIRRRIGFSLKSEYFKPQGIPLRELEEVELGLDEVEALRLKDYLGLDQAESANKMGVSTSTFQRILESAHKKIAEAIYQGQAIKIFRKEVKNMPNMDGKGPGGEGPMTGRGLGDCKEEDVKRGSVVRPRNGQGLGLGRRPRAGKGRVVGRGRNA